MPLASDENDNSAPFCDNTSQRRGTKEEKIYENLTVKPKKHIAGQAVTYMHKDGAEAVPGLCRMERKQNLNCSAACRHPSSQHFKQGEGTTPKQSRFSK